MPRSSSHTPHQPGQAPAYATRRSARAAAGASSASASSPASSNGSAGAMTSPMALKDISLTQLSQLSVPQLAQLQQQLSHMSQLSVLQHQQQVAQIYQQQPPMDGVTATSINMGIKTEGGYRSHGRQPSNSHLMHQYNPLSPSHHHQQHLLHPLSPPPPFHHHLLAPPAQSHFSANFNPPPSFPAAASSHHATVTKSVPAPRRNSRTTSGARLSPTPFPTVNLKLKRKLRKNNREKQRRSEINDQFEVLCSMLGLGGGVAGVTSSTPAPATAGGATSAQPKVEKFTILSEACHSITQLRLELAVYKAEKDENRTEFQKLGECLEHTFKTHGVALTAEEVLTRFFPSLQRPDYVLPPSKAALPKSASMDSDDDGDEEADGDKDMGQTVQTASVGEATDHSGSASTVPAQTPAEKRRAVQAAAAAAASAVVSPVFSPPALPSPTHTYAFGPAEVGVAAAGGTSPSLSSLLSGSGATGTIGRTAGSRNGSINRGIASAVDPSIPTHRPRAHSRSNSNSGMPRFGSNDFGTPSPIVAAAAKSAHSRQASQSHARSRSLQMSALISGVKEEAVDGDKPTLESLHSRVGSTFIPPPPSIPGVVGGAPRLNLHTSTNSMDLGYGGLGSSGMLHSPSHAQAYSFYSAPTPTKYGGRPPGHGRHPSGSNSSALGSFLHGGVNLGMSLDAHGHAIPHPAAGGAQASAQLHHHRHRSTASIGGDMFGNVNMEDDADLGVFETSYGQ